MQVHNIYAVYFSPTGTSKRVACALGEALSSALSLPLQQYDFTTPPARKQALHFSPGDLVVLACPVYAGRVPNLILPYIRSITGAGALAVAVVLYGNRAFDDALIELRDSLCASGFSCLAAAAFVGEHSFSAQLAGGRPDAHDLSLAAAFAGQMLQKLRALAEHTPLPTLPVDGNEPILPHYRPTDRADNFVDIRKVKPRTSEACTNCGLCAAHCPMGAIDPAEAAKIPGICIKCNACVRLCPQHAKSFVDEGYLYHRDDLIARYGHLHRPVRTYL